VREAAGHFAERLVDPSRQLAQPLPFIQRQDAPEDLSLLDSTIEPPIATESVKRNQELDATLNERGFE